jgi:23S rRNA (guanine2445-N2)-methyltransferase / 23S rRNA (guanine2069-N7)-methyltransferase
VFGTPRDRIAIKTRMKRGKLEQYGRQDERGHAMTVSEGGLKFEVNLFDYLDTGLFLDHRPLRAKVRELASGKRFVNLFCYTGAVTVYACAGGAASTASVDLSNTYLDWAERNLALNRLGSAKDRLVQADAMEWIERDRDEYDLIYVDPPTFSNSKRAEDFDVQHDHVRLLKACAARLAPGGLILFSNNNRRFKIDRDALAELDIRDVTPATIPFDFARDPKIHHCFEIRHR